MRSITMKTILEFEAEEYKKMLSTLDLSDESEDKSQYFNAWNFGETTGAYVVTNELVTQSCSCNGVYQR